MQNRIAVIGFLVVAACRTIEPNPPPEAPRIDSFTIDKSRIAQGESATLTFKVTGATKVEVFDDLGAQVQLAGSATDGTATVAPTVSTFYVLRATGQGGRDTAFVQLAVNAPLRDVFLVAVPATVIAGQSATLLWGAAGASTVTLTGSVSGPQTLTGTSGTVTVIPARTESFTLSAEGAPGAPKAEAIAVVTVKPVVISATFSAGADGVAPDSRLVVYWRTAGATRLTLSERNFGQLTEVTDPATAATGSFEWLVPTTLPNGLAVGIGTPLRFTVTAQAGTDSVSREVIAVVGDAPAITLFEAPENATTGGTFTIHWRTLNATKVTVAAAGVPVFETLPAEQERVTDGRLTLSTPASATDFVFTATNDTGVAVTETFQVKPVAAPTITTFTLPSSINALGDGVTARWTTSNATRLVLKLEGGAQLATITAPAQVASGSVSVALGSDTNVVLEAYNAAGAVARATQPFEFFGAVTIDPLLALRGDAVTLEWNLSTAGITQVMGLPTPPPAPVTGSTNFIDLTSRPSAIELTFDDTNDGAEELPVPAGFVFPLLGRAHTRVWASVNGFISFAPPGPRAANLDLTATDGGVPTLVAPFWDDLSVPDNGQILFDTAQSQSGEQVLVVQWEHVQVAGDATSDLRFQAQLSETGQVSFIYDTLAGTISSATIGVNVAERDVRQQYTFNSNSTIPSAGLELDYFVSGPADGTASFPADRTERVSFFGRTATSRVAFNPLVRAFKAGDLRVTEVLPVPEASTATTGQWIEVQNNTSFTVDLEGIAITTGGSADGGVTFGQGARLDAGAFLVVGQSTDPGLNGGANVSVASDDLPMSGSGIARVSLGVGGAELSALAWDAGTAGTSIVYAPPLLRATGQTFACPTRTGTFGGAGSIGTPSLHNELCAPYSVDAIPGAFRNAPVGAGIRLSAVDMSTIADEGVAVVNLAVPFTYFGTPYTQATVSTNGMLAFGDPLAANVATNPTTVSTTTPNGTVAPFWDDLEIGPSGLLAVFRSQDRTIVSWENVRQFDNPGTLFNVQVHLIDDGSIEFHYGTMLGNSGFEQNLARGSSATVWLESPAGTFAIPWGVNAPVIAPRSGVRFVPAP